MRVVPRVLFLMLLTGLLCCTLDAQAPQKITVRMLDSKTGLLIASSNFLVRVDHNQEAHGDWIVKNEDGTGSLSVPSGAQLISIHATYESATYTYANCDVDKDRASSSHAARIERWYPVSAIQTAGLVAPNDCGGKKVPEKLQVIAKPGEFVFFVRPETSIEKLRD
jgi:hypothetical protein